MTPTLNDLTGSADFRRLNAKALGLTLGDELRDATNNLTQAERLALHKKGMKIANKAIRQAYGDGLNQTERRAFQWLKANGIGEDDRLVPHGITFVLANGLKYTPDITQEGPDAIVCYDCKAMRKRKDGTWYVHVEDDSAAKLKMAAQMWRRITFVLIWHDKQKGWQMQVVR